ncbi:MAG TPA: Holliday junction branch migration protein RuvA [Jatrophihabitans sp.]|nr:Holliday junction branch migration protein RuvA [Jatrophihabitans sp.]
MIAEVTGTVRSIAPDGVVVAVGGVGLQVQATPGTLARLRVGESATLATALVVREDSLTLYGFADTDERDVFEALQTASGVGPRLAQAVLGVLSPEAVRAAIADEDLAALTAVPGIGRKVAQRLVLELAGRLGPPRNAGVGAPDAGGDAADVRAGLVALGYSQREADAAVTAVRADGAVPAGAPTTDVLRAALSVLRRS